MRKLIILLFVIPVSFITKAQQFVPCGTDELYHQTVLQHPEIARQEDEANAKVREQMNSLMLSKAGTVRYIPVVFHIIHHSGFENISESQIMDQIRVWNEDYRKLAGTNGFSSDPLATDMEYEFRLAQYDPNGNKHDGINRIYNPALDTGATNAVKALSFWDSKKYLNVWVVSSINSSSTGGAGTILGYAQFPWLLSSQGATDGIVVRADQVGMINFADASQAGRTLTHEVGHWLGLYHTFQGGCVGGTSSNCSTQGDQVCDTPPVEAASYGCQTTKNSCNNDVPNLPDLIRDYMDYSDGSCMNLFTTGQKTRVNGMMSYRTGIFGSSPAYTQNITYSGLNNNGTYTAVPAASRKAPYFYGFEEADPTVSGWRINNFNNPGNGWQSNSSIAYNGGRSFYMRNFTNATAKVNSRDGFQTPEIDLSTVATPTLEFYYAYAMKSTATNDSFTVRISDDFGMHEDVVVKAAGNSLTTNGIQSSEYFPGRQDWRKVSVDLSAYKNYTHARFRFEFLNRRGNNIYVDDVSITDGATGIEDNLKNSMKFTVYPNPMNTSATVSFELQHTSKMNISVVDILGKEVMMIENKEFSAGPQEITIQKNNLTHGIYFIRVNADGTAFSHKLLIN